MTKHSPMDTAPILYNTKPFERGSDALINPRIDRVISQLEEMRTDFKNATAHGKKEDRANAQAGFNKLNKVEQELFLIKRSISNHTA